MPMAVTWLNQHRFNDYEPEAISTEQRDNEAAANSKGWFWIEGRWQFKGVEYGSSSMGTNAVAN